MSTLQNRLSTLLGTFTVPSEKLGDLHWLNSNIAIKNSGHRDLPEVQRIIVELLQEKNKKRINTFINNK